MRRAVTERGQVLSSSWQSEAQQSIGKRARPHAFQWLLAVIVALLPSLLAAQTATLSGVVYGGSAPLANTTVEALTNGTTTAVAQATTNSSGQYSLAVTPATYDLRVTPPAGSGFGQEVVQDIDVTSNRQYDVILLAQGSSAVVSGTVRGLGGQAIAGANVQAYSTASGQFLANTSTDSAGRYSIGVASGGVHLYFNRSGASTIAPSSWYYRRYNISITGATTFDVDLSVIRLSGNATDSNGVPVANVNVQANTSRYDSPTQTEMGSSGNVNSNAAGAYEMLLIGAPGSVTVRPTAASGFSLVSLSNVALTSNLTQRVVLQLPDATPPIIVTKPVVVHLSDTSVSIGWTTNEPSTSRVDFGLGGLSSTQTSNTLVTSHSITLVDLVATGIYTYRVGSIDKNGNGPTSSDIGYFTTQAPPGDVTAPVITSGPGTGGLGDTTAFIQWTTDEPATSVVEYGDTASLGTTAQDPPGVFLKNHSIALSGLRPSTTYHALVRSVDPDGNATASSTFTFTTADVPDTQPPVISGLSVVSVTHSSITVAWTTNEAATSALSYNDGGAYNVIGDQTLVTRHELTLAGLTAQRTYNITVSSKDAAGNGPTLSGPIQATTLGAADATPPVISGLSTTPAKRSATMTWSTNEPSSTEVSYGTVQGNHDNFMASLPLATSHSVSLTGLEPSTTYYVAISVTDSSGNTFQSPEFSFTTLTEETNLPPTRPGPFSVSSNPNRSGSFTITWGASADDSPGGVASYEVFRNGLSVSLLSPLVTTFAENGLAEGNYEYRVRAADSTGLTTDSDAIVVVVDQTAPVLNMPGSVSTPATTATDAIVNYTVTATDTRDPSPVVLCSPPSGRAFVIGTTPVACSATDAAGNQSTGTFNVIVTDPFPPVLTVPNEIRADATTSAGAIVTFSASAIDNADPAPSVLCNPASGSLFPVGTTAVSCTATDASQNSVTRMFNVIVAPPAIAATTTSITISPSAPTFGQTVTVNIAVASGTGIPTGTVNLYEGPALLGTATLSGSPASASISISAFNAGEHTIRATYEGSPSHEASASPNSIVTVGKATPIVAVTAGTHVYDGQPHGATATVTGVNGASLAGATLTYNGSPAQPVNAGSYAVEAIIAESSNYHSASGTATLTITRAPATITLSALLHCYDGQAKQAVATVVPGGLQVSVTYAGSATPPTEAGSYAVQATLQDDNYEAPPANGTLEISRVDAAISASGPTTFCSGGSVTLSSNSTSGSALKWYRDGIEIGTGLSITASSAGRYVLVARNSDGCEAASSYVDVVVNPLPAVPTVTTTSASGQATLTSSAASSYQWSRDGVAIAGANQQVLTTTDSGSYVVNVTNEHGCSMTSAPSSITITRSGQSSFSSSGVTVSTTAFPEGTMLSIDADPTMPPAPTGYYTLTAADGTLLMAYDIKATGSALSRIEITFDVPAEAAPDFKTLRSLRILHGEMDASGNLVLVDRTVRHEWKAATTTTPAVRRVIASVSSLSPFVLGYVLSPTIDSIVAPSDPVAINAAVSVEAAFTDPTSGDPLAGDVFTAEWNWGDGTIDSGLVTRPGIDEPGKVTGSHTYQTAGVYTVTLTLRDGTVAGGSATQIYRYIVVYDSRAGFVTGGGWINSPAGAYADRPLAVGKASFGFVSRYQNGNSVPTGNTSFEFHAGDFRFKSEVYEWLVVAGPRAQFKGRGKVNGAGDYGFLLSAVDGQTNGGGGVDKFRIKIWDRTDDRVIYDNVRQAGDDLEGSDPQAIGGGSIVFHKGN